MNSPAPSTNYATSRLPERQHKPCGATLAEEALPQSTSVSTDLSRLMLSERKHRIKIGAAASTLDLVIKYHDIMLKEISATGADDVMAGLSDDIREVSDMLASLKECLLERDEAATKAINQILTSSELG